MPNLPVTVKFFLRFRKVVVVTGLIVDPSTLHVLKSSNPPGAPQAPTEYAIDAEGPAPSPWGSPSLPINLFA